MGSQRILLISIGLSAIQIVCGQVWQFGADNVPSAVVISEYNGEFSLFQREQHIQIIVPPCHVVTYVRVQVHNVIASPEVYYNSQTNIVSIHYPLWKLSSSSFNIIAKAVQQPGCNISPQQPGQQVPQNPNLIPQDQQPYLQPNQNFPQDQQPYLQPNQNFPQDQQPYPRPNQNFPQDQQPYPRPNQNWPSRN